eukprot:gene8918-12026_t
MSSFILYGNSNIFVNKFKNLKLFSSRARGRTEPPVSLYEVLGVSRTATAQEIKIAYFREAKKSHPDLNPNDFKAKERFQKVRLMRLMDMSIIMEAFQSYTDEIKEGIVVPTALFIRYPPAVFFMLRIAYLIGQTAVAGLVYTGNLEIAARTIWNRIVALSLERRKRNK